MGDNRIELLRLAHLGPGAAVGVHRPGGRDVLAAEPVDDSLVTRGDVVRAELVRQLGERLGAAER